MTGKYATRTTFTGTARFTIANSFACTPAAGERVALWLGGAYMDTAVFINGREAGQWKKRLYLFLVRHHRPFAAG